MRTVVVVQARAGSTRLPNKVLLPICGAPALTRMLERLRAVRSDVTLVVATTTDAADDAIVALADAAAVPSFRGHPTDCLDRHVQAARAFAADVVVKIPSDCPLIDPAIVDRVLAAFDPVAHDYVSNLHPQSWPDGNDVEVMPLAALELAAREADRPFQREHTTPFLWDQPARFRIGNVAWERDLSRSHRFVLDYAEDLAFIRAVYEALWRPERPVFGLDEILALCAARPELMELNAKYCGVNWYRHNLDELRTVGAADTRGVVEPSG